MRRRLALSPSPDIVVLGAGVIGLSIALELHRRGHVVALRDPRPAATQASWAAAGMLAAQDPHNPPALRPLADRSAALYPAFLHHLAELSGLAVPFQTQSTVQHLASGNPITLSEHSLDPRQLALALITAVQAAGIPVYTDPAQPLRKRLPGIVVHASGAWSALGEIAPMKGQMLRVQLPAPGSLTQVHRSEHVYVVPRTTGPQAGTALIGATVENVGFNTEVVPEDLRSLREMGAALVPALPELTDSKHTPLVEAWAGLRPATPDKLPLLGESTRPGVSGKQRHLIASGHFRNGILLAPVTAVLLADMVEERPPAFDLTPFAPARFIRNALVPVSV